MLDIIVTHYREAWETVKPFFDMLSLQRGFPFSKINVILVHDGGNEYPADYFAGYPFDVEQLVIPHGGVSAARNAGLFHSRAEWVNFCDCDDSYTYIFALRDILSALTKATELCFMRTDLCIYDPANNAVVISPEKQAFVFIHGKYYRRQWVIDSGIRFDTDFSFQEDSLFNALLIAATPYQKTGKIITNYPPYVWNRRPGSVTNSQKNADRATWGHFRRNVKVCEYYRDHLSKERITGMVVRSVYDAFFMLNSKKDISDDMRSRIKEALKAFLAEFGKYWERPDCKTLEQIEEISTAELMETPIDSSFGTVTLWKQLFERTVA